MRIIRKEYLKENFEKIISQSTSLIDVLKKLNLEKTGGGYTTIKKYITIYKCDTSHFIKENCFGIRKKLELNEVLTINSNYQNTSHLKERLYKEGYKKRECEFCEQGEEWKGKKMSLILDHINGINNDNRIENLRIVCPNCNATLDTHCKGYKKMNKLGEIA